MLDSSLGQVFSILDNSTPSNESTGIALTWRKGEDGTPTDGEGWKRSKLFNTIDFFLSNVRPFAYHVSCAKSTR